MDEECAYNDSSEFSEMVTRKAYCSAMTLSDLAVRRNLGCVIAMNPESYDEGAGEEREKGGVVTPRDSRERGMWSGEAIMRRKRSQVLAESVVGHRSTPSFR
jgi:hypothetical protein